MRPRVSGARRHRAPSSSCGPASPRRRSPSSLSSSSSSSSTAAAPPPAPPPPPRRGAARGAPSSRGGARACARTARTRPYDRAHPSMPHVNTFSSSLSHRRACASWGGGASAANSASAPTAPPDARSTGPGDARARRRGGPDREHLEPTGIPPHHLSAAAVPVSNWNCSTASESVRRFFPARRRARRERRFFERRTPAARRPGGVPSRSPVSPRVAAAANLEYSFRASTPSSPAYPSAREESRAVAPTPATAPPPRLRDRERVPAAAAGSARGAGHGCGLRGGFFAASPPRRPGARPAESRPLRPTRGSRERRGARIHRHAAAAAAPRASDARGGDARRGELRGRRRYGPLAVHRVVRGGRTHAENIENMSRLLEAPRSPDLMTARGEAWLRRRVRGF